MALDVEPEVGGASRAAAHRPLEAPAASAPIVGEPGLSKGRLADVVGRLRQGVRHEFVPAAVRARAALREAAHATREQLSAGATKAAERLGPPIARSASKVGTVLAPLWPGSWSRYRFKNLLLRILAANAAGLLVMLGGIIYLSKQQSWLIDAKIDSLKAQSEIIAAAIAADAVQHDRGITFADPDRLMEPDAAPAGGYPTQDVRDFEFAIEPDRVAPVLHRLTRPSGTRARVYARDGTLIYDSASFASGVVRLDLAPPSEAQDPSDRTFVQWFWGLFVPSELPIYKEIGNRNGMAYPEVRSALLGVTQPLLMATDRGKHIVSVAAPIQRMKAVQGALLLSTRDGEIDGVMRRERHIILWAFSIAVAATVLSAAWLAGTIAGPMQRLSEAALAVKRNIRAASDLPTFPDRKDEIGKLADSFKDMTQALFRRIELSEKFAADVAHELKNPIAAVRSSAETLVYAKSEEDRAELLSSIQRDLKRLNRLITDISNFSRLDAELSLNQATTVDLRSLVDGVAGVFNDIHAREQGPPAVRVTIEGAAAQGADGLTVAGHESRLGQVLTNLVDNALSFSPPHGQVAISARVAGEEIEIAVEDEGPGIPEDRLEKVFERFYTDRPGTEAASGKNSGLGLSISREIVEGHGGTIWAENRKAADGRICGARFVLRLPTRQAARPRATARKA